MPKILIAMPAHNTTYPEVLKGMWNMDLGGNEVYFQTMRGYSVDVARNMLAKEFLDDTDYEYILFLDADNVPRRDTLNRLLAVGADISAAWYMLRSGRPSAMRLVKEKNERFGTYKAIEMREILAEDKPIDIDGGGMGCVLIKRKVLESMRKTYNDKWFEYIVYPNGTTLSEDNNFMGRAKGSGFTIKLDPYAKVGHIIYKDN